MSTDVRVVVLQNYYAAITDELLLAVEMQSTLRDVLVKEKDSC